jgi:2-epi-valiolone-7-phosphate 1-reductase
VCGTDIQIARGDRGGAAWVLGHEAVGELESRPGELAVFNPVDAFDQDHVFGHSFDGAFRSVVPLLHRSPELVWIPTGLPLELYVLCEPVGAALYGWELGGDLPAKVRVGIWGAGAMGLIHSHLALSQDHSVHLVHRRRSRLDWVRSRVFSDALAYHLPGADKLEEIDVAFICTDRTGTDEALNEAIQALVPGGLVVLVGGVPPGYRNVELPEVDLSAVRRLSVRGRPSIGGGIVRATTRRGKAVGVAGHRGTSVAQILDAQRLISRNVGFFGKLVTHIVDYGSAVELINQRCEHYGQDRSGTEIVKIVVRPQER